MAGKGVPNNRIAGDLLMKRPRVLYWRRRYLENGIRGLWDAGRTPPRERISEAVEQAVVFDSLYRPKLFFCPQPCRIIRGLRWTVHNLSEVHGISPASVGRIWKKHGIQMGGLTGIKMDKLKISLDPLFPVTVCHIGLLYDVVAPVVVFCACQRPLSDLDLSSLPPLQRRCLASRLAAQFQELEDVRHDDYWAKFKTRAPKQNIGALSRFICAISDKYQDMQIHALFANHYLNPQEVPSVRKWLEAIPRLHLHYAPYAVPNGQIWSEYATHWLSLIARWPMQASLVASVEAVTRILEGHPNDELDDLILA